MTSQQAAGFPEDMAKTLRLEAQAIENLISTVDHVQLSTLVDRIAACKGHILTSGAGTSGILARKFAHTLCCVGKPAVFLSPVDGVHGGSGMICGDELAIFFSKGGETQELKALLVPLAHRKIDTVLVTEQPDSMLGRQCTHILRVGPFVEADPNNVIATTSITAVNALFDAVCMRILSHTGYSLEDFAPTHPGGAVGKRLLGGKEA